MVMVMMMMMMMMMMGGTKHWLQDQDLLRSYGKSRGPWDKPVATWCPLSTGWEPFVLQPFYTMTQMSLVCGHVPAEADLPPFN
jgi:hypothetical protein